MRYIYENDKWPEFTWDDKQITLILGKVRHLQGMVFGKMGSLGFSVKEETMLSTLTLDVLKSSEIEGEILNYEQVRSSIARRLGMEYAGIVANRNVEGIVEMMLDATQKYNKPLDEERIFGWHAALFPTGWSGMHRIVAGNYRNGEMQIVSGAMGKEKIHFQAPSPGLVKKEMDVFLGWLNNETGLDDVLKAAIAHFWFIIIHPFDDGNGRIARAISDMLLARSENSFQRFYSLSNQILIEKKNYYEILQKVQHSSGDITEWLVWFLNCLYHALENTEVTLEKILQKADFWQKHKDTSLNSRQRLMLNKLLDGFDGKLKTSKWAKIAKCSADTALRDIKDLMDKGILKQEESGGRSTNYELILE
ncbi:Fic family protein [Pseudarcicella hirudinis]|uniref:Fic family protein n=1 Tax=Pseudarcicella hirudinis TaxID=1079859 RepID=A0A1I5TWU5_9BACT|nr:Fic family protein [Pseudarcicella hirudinis]SFP87535.1 Fic family protein [Pseudarcicella hirudinis]